MHKVRSSKICTQVFIQTPYAMHQSNWPPGSPDSSWYTARIKAEQPICEECRRAKQEKAGGCGGGLVCTTVKATQEKENTLSSSQWTSSSQESEQQETAENEGWLYKPYMLFINRVNTIEEEPMSGGRSPSPAAGKNKTKQNNPCFQRTTTGEFNPES